MPAPSSFSTATDLNYLIGQSLESVGMEATKKKVVIAPDFFECLPPISIDPLRLDRVFTNLVNNAIQASPEGQTVHIRTRLHKGAILVDVVDCRCGIQLDQRDRLFEPFFITKREGTGLGLLIVKKLVEAHGGMVHVTSTPGAGATFRIILPDGNE